MPLAHRIIPTFLVKRQTLVKGKRFSGDRVVGHAKQAILIQAARGVDEVCVLDITATKEGRGPDLKLIEDLAQGLFAPLAVGGGVRSLADVRALLRAGADKVVIGSAPYIIRECADVVGSQAIVAALDVITLPNGLRITRTCATHESVNVSGAPIERAKELEQLGAGEILLTSIEREGAMEGYNLDLIRGVSAAVSVPVIAHGGCRDYEDMAAAISCGASAVAAGALFQFTENTPRGAAQYLAAKGVEVRL